MWLPILVTVTALAQAPTQTMAAPPSDPEVASACVTVLRAAQRHDLELLLPLFDEHVDLDGRESLTRREVVTLVRTWPEDFGPAFWRDVRDVLRHGRLDLVEGFIWRHRATVIQFRKTEAGARVSAIHRSLQLRTKIMPVDLAAYDSGLRQVRDQIKRAVAQRDTDLLRPVLGPDIAVDFGDASLMPEEFVTKLKTCTVDVCGDLWRELHDVLELGMALDTTNDVAVAPYLSEKLPDEFDALAITGRGVALRAAPHADAKRVAVLSYDLVEMVEGPDWFNDEHKLRIDGFDYDWRQVVTASGVKGWVSEKFARNGFDTRIFFKKIDGVWKLIAMARGD